LVVLKAPKIKGFRLEASLIPGAFFIPRAPAFFTHRAEPPRHIKYILFCKQACGKSHTERLTEDRDIVYRVPLYKAFIIAEIFVPVLF